MPLTFQQALEIEEVKKHRFQIYKADEDQRLVFGWASVAVTREGQTVVDLQDDIIQPEDLEQAVYDYVLQFRDGGDEHDPARRKTARLVESCVFTAGKLSAMGLPEGSVPLGWWVGFYVDDDSTWEKIKSGEYRMFSIEGRGVRQPVEED